MKKSRQYLVICFLSVVFFAGQSYAGITFAPYVSIRSTKSINPQKDDSTETEKIKQRQEAGLRIGVSFWRLFSTTLSVGQSVLTTTEKVQDIKDEYDEIDYEADMNMSTDDPEANVKTTETQQRAKFSLMIDPSFSIFILRAKIGVTATNRNIVLEQTGLESETKLTGPTYKPHSGLGAGIRLGPRMYFMIEYEANHYKFPDIEPFEREVSVNYSIAI